MRLKLTLSQTNESQSIPINYQYYISSFIYKTIEKADPEYADWLHEEAYRSGNKKFKLFSFSKLDIPKMEIAGNYINVLSRKMYLTIAIQADKMFESLLLGLFKREKLSIYTGDDLALFNVEFVENIPDPLFSEKMHFRTMSPVVIRKKQMHNGKESAKYLSPDEPDFFEYFKRNIEEKYIAYAFKNGSRITPRTLESFRILGNIKPKLITIKEGRSDEIKIKGYNFEFEVSGNPEMLKLAYNAGFGCNNSLGFGCVRVVN